MLVRVLAVAGLMSAASVAGAALAQGGRFSDVRTSALMIQTINPAALAFWAGGNDPPEDETAAQAEARWSAAVQGAVTMQARATDLLAHSRPGRWDEYTHMMAEIAREGEAAARARDAEAAFEIGGRLYDSCNGCHKAYVPVAQPAG
jgi:cytochrome c556